MDFPVINPNKLGEILDFCKEKLEFLKSQDDLEFEPSEGELFWFIPPIKEDRKHFYDILYLEMREYDNRPIYYVAVNILSSNMGKTFESLDQALIFGREVIANTELLKILSSMRPSIMEVAQNIADMMHGKVEPKKGPILN